MYFEKRREFQRVAMTLCIFAMVLLTGGSLSEGKSNEGKGSGSLSSEGKSNEGKGKKDCPPVDIVDSAGIMHWSCREVSNGAGGLKCALGYQGLHGCENCANCQCTNSGSGASQRCKCM
jgi:hypothetical protein